MSDSSQAPSNVDWGREAAGQLLNLREIAAYTYHAHYDTEALALKHERWYRSGARIASVVTAATAGATTASLAGVLPAKLQPWVLAAGIILPGVLGVSHGILSTLAEDAKARAAAAHSAGVAWHDVAARGTKLRDDAGIGRFAADVAAFRAGVDDLFERSQRAAADQPPTDEDAYQAACAKLNKTWNADELRAYQRFGWNAAAIPAQAAAGEESAKHPA